MVEAEVRIHKEVLLGQLRGRLATSTIFQPSRVERALEIEDQRMYGGGPYILKSTQEDLTVELQPFAVRGKYAGQPSYWRLYPHNESGLTAVTIYKDGLLDHSERKHVVVTTPDRRHPLYDNDEAIAIAGEVIGRIPEGLQIVRLHGDAHTLQFDNWEQMEAAG